MEPFSLQAWFAANLKRLRLEAGLSQEELADLAGIHRTYVGSVERAERNITLRVVAKFAVALDVHPIELLREPPR